MLKSPAEAKDRNVLLPGMKPGEYAMINQPWRYIRYADGGEELYGIRQDPNEWTNLAGNAKLANVKKRLKGAAPTSFAKPGASASELKLVIEGENFRWRSRQ